MESISLNPASPLAPSCFQSLQPGQAEYSETLQGLVRHIQATMDTSRTDRLWPADPMVFQTNPLSVAYGACGTSLFLYDMLGELPSPARDWLLAQPITVDAIPPGLYSGIAGIAWTFAEIGMVERGAEILHLVPRSPLAFSSADLFHGAAGWGMASLAMYLRTGDDKLLALACQGGDHLTRTAQRNADGACWPDENDGLVRLGLALGGSGIALFLLNLWRATGDPIHLETARLGIDFEVAQGHLSSNGALSFAAVVGDSIYYPYWLRGSGGVASALIRFFQVLREERYLELAHRVIRDSTAFFSVAPHLFEGLASMGDALLDMFQVTGERSYLELAQQKAKQILLYRIERPEGTAFPGRYLTRISHDYGVGGAGIGIFLHRLAGLRPHRFQDIYPEE